MLELSIDTGKCLDVEILTKVCLECQRIKTQTDASKKAEMQKRHQCKANYQGQRHLWKHKGSRGYLGEVRKHVSCNIQSTYGDGDSKAYNDVEHAYQNINVEKRSVLVMFRRELGRPCGN